LPSTEWKIESSDDGNNWIVIEIQENNKELNESEKILLMKLIAQVICSHLRITFLTSSNFSVIRLKGFELFGQILDSDFILRRFLQVPKQLKAASSMAFEFSKSNNCGLFYCFRDSSISNQNEYFCVFSSDSSKGYSVQALLHWNNDIWISREKSDARFYLHFKHPWIFKPTGYRLRAGNQKYLRSWKFRGQKTTSQNMMNLYFLDEQKNHSFFTTEFSEASFPVSTERFFDSFVLQLNVKNSEMKNQLCLSSFEIFGVIWNSK
jgi:hypothetical protein